MQRRFHHRVSQWPKRRDDAQLDVAIDDRLQAVVDPFDALGPHA